MVFFALTRQAAGADGNAKILFIASYNPSFHSFSKQIDGLKAGLRENGYLEKNYVLDIEFLDSKRFPLTVRERQFEQTLAYKLGNLPRYDVVVVADDNALNFAKDKRTTLFGGSKIVFLGVNSLSLALAQNANPHIVGVVEQRSVGETLSLASRLFPRGGPVHVIADNTPTGQINQRHLNEVLKTRPDLAVKWHYLGEQTYDQLFGRLQALPIPGPLFLNSVTRDVAGRHLNSREFLARLKAVFAGPIFTVQRNSIGHGALGGKIVSHFEQGREAAGLVSKILSGVASDTLRVITRSPNVYMFDYNELKRLNIDVADLPSESQIIGAPDSFIEKYGRWIAPAIILIALQSAFILLLFFNMRERRMAEGSLHESEARFRAFFDNSPSVMYIKNRDQKLSYVNAQYLAQYGVAAEDVIGKRGGSRLTDAQKDAVEKLDRTVMEQRTTARNTVAIESEQGEIRQFYITKFPVYGAQGEITGIGGINTDVTELHEREEELRDAKAQAEKAAAVADAANRTKSSFLATMSHEIRTPMNGVLGTADLLARTSLTPDQREFVDIMKESGKSLLDLLNDILDLSKIEAGSVQLDEQEFSIIEMLHSTNSLWARIAEDKGLSFSVDHQFEAGAVILSDRNRLRQVINNLVGNAIKFTDTGHIKVSASESVLDEQTTRLRFEVSDTGIGISEEQKARIFEPFTQADSSTTRKFGGTGLGLAICKNLAGLLGGEIGVDSCEGDGTTFWFTITAKRGAAKQAEGAAIADALPSTTNQNDRLLHILIAEDNKLNQQIISWMLGPLNCQFDIVENGREAIAAAIRSTYDLILMDVQMPEVDGVAAAREIHTIESPNKDIPIIALTANAMQGDRDKYLKEGMTDYVSKPIDQRELLAVISRCAGVSMPEINSASTPMDVGAEASADEAGDTSSEELDKLVGELDNLLEGTGH